MEIQARQKTAQRGFSLIELALVIAVILILSMFAITSFGNAGETRDASMVQSTQASLQSLISQGAVRMDKKPYDLAADDTNAILTAVRSSIGEGGGKNRGVTFTSTAPRQFTMTIQGSNRSAVFTVVPTGDVRLVSLSSNFQNYKVDANGVIQKK